MVKKNLFHEYLLESHKDHFCDKIDIDDQFFIKKKCDLYDEHLYNVIIEILIEI